MLDRLHALHERSEEITTKLADPAVTNDPAQLAALSKELSRLTPLVRLRERWMELNDRIEEARELVLRRPQDPSFNAEMVLSRKRNFLRIRQH